MTSSRRRRLLPTSQPQQTIQRLHLWPQQRRWHPTSFFPLTLAETLRSPFYLFSPKVLPKSLEIKMSSFQTSDLESGPKVTGIAEAEPPSSKPSLQQEKSLGTKAMANSRPPPNPQPRTPDRPKDGNIFVGDAGQSLLLVFDSSKPSAILVRVFRPSVAWALRMESMERAGKTLPVKAPEKAKFDVERWTEFRWLHRGEDEVDIWKRIKQQYLAHHPKWYPYLPFWRPVLVEERNASTPPHQTTEILS